MYKIHVCIVLSKIIIQKIGNPFKFVSFGELCTNAAYALKSVFREITQFCTLIVLERHIEKVAMISYSLTFYGLQSFIQKKKQSIIVTRLSK